MDNYRVTFMFDYCMIEAYCYADSEDSAPDLAWEWVSESIGVNGDVLKNAIDITVDKIREEL